MRGAAKGISVGIAFQKKIGVGLADRIYAAGKGGGKGKGEGSVLGSIGIGTFLGGKD
jgi:hypothetical protein